MKKDKLSTEKILKEAFDELHENLLNRESVDIAEIKKYANRAKDKYFTFLFYYLEGAHLFNAAKYPEAHAIFQSCMTEFEEGSSMHSYSLYWAGRAFTMQGNLIEAMKYLRLSVFGFSVLKNESALIKAKHYLSLPLANMGFHEEALQMLDSCGGYYLKQQKYRDLVAVNLILGNIYGVLHKYDSGEKCFSEAGELVQAYPQLFEKFDLAGYYKQTGDFYLRREQVSKALEYYEKMVKLKLVAIHPYSEAAFYWSYNKALFLSKDFDRALHFAKVCLNKAKPINARQPIRGTLETLSQIYIERNDFVRAEKILMEALKEAEISGSDAWKSDVHEMLYSLYKRKGDLKNAMRQLELQKESTEKYSNSEIDIRVKAVKALNEIHSKQMQLVQSEADLLIKKQELDLAAIYLKQKTTLLKELENFVSGLRRENAQKQKMFKAIHDKLKEAGISVTENDSFKEKIGDANRHFINAFRKKFPSISKTEAEIAALLVKGMNTKEISNLMVLDKRAIEQHRYRLRKKLGLNRTEDLAITLSDFAK